MDDKLKVAVSQIRCVAGDVQANVKKIETFVEEAARRKCEAVVFPEMSDTGYNRDAIIEKASPWPGDPLDRIREAARRFRIFILCGLSERESGRLFNSVAIIDAEGELAGKYRKTHLAAFSPLNEHEFLSPGESVETFQIGGMKFGAAVCYDLRFPEFFRAMALKGAEAIALSSAWPFPRLRHWETLINARAIENQAYLIASNHVGPCGDVVFCGASRIVDPFGVTVASASEESETLIVGEIEKGRLRSVRKAMAVFDHRRADLYR